MKKFKAKAIKYLKVAAFAGLALTLLGTTYKSSQRKAGIANNAVMITNIEKTSGGTGVVLKSYQNKSFVLTNKHVCKVVENSGVVQSVYGDYQVVDYVESVKSDLCIISVNSDLRGQTYIAGKAPSMYDHAKISGFPALMPNVISEGHVSGKRTIQVMTGMRACTADDFKGPNGIFCALLGGVPMIQSYESVLVTATIMPGSSGSAVYGPHNTLIGLVFAGQGSLGYSWTVPYEQVVAFINDEYRRTKPTPAPNKIELGGAQEKNSFSELKEKCENIKLTEANREVFDVCKIIKKDVTL